MCGMRSGVVRWTEMSSLRGARDDIVYTEVHRQHSSGMRSLETPGIRGVAQGNGNAK